MAEQHRLRSRIQRSATAAFRGITNPWPFYAFAFGMATLYAQQSDLQLSRAFEAGHSATTMALVHTKKIKAYPRKETMYTLAYVYQIDSTVYRSHYQCNCPVLRDVLEGSEIQVTYQLTDPQNSRPTLVNYNPSGLSFGVAFSWILTIGGAIGSTYLLLTRGKT